VDGISALLVRCEYEHPRHSIFNFIYYANNYDRFLSQIPIMATGSVSLVQTPIAGEKIHPTEHAQRAEPGASWKEDEIQHLPKNRLGIVFFGLMSCISLAALDEVRSSQTARP
jgi:hypothetical protein